MVDPPLPQNARFANAPGEYKLAIRVSKAEIDPGGEVNLEIFVTGYGEIRGAKLVVYPPPYFIDLHTSKVIHDLEAGEQPEDPVVFGETEKTFEEVGSGEQEGVVHITFGGYKGDNWGFYSTFFDVPPTDINGDVWVIATETRSGRAPITMPLKARCKAPPGDHNLRFYLTYYNGSQWKIDSQSVSITARAWFRRHEGLTWGVGITAAE